MILEHIYAFGIPSRGRDDYCGKRNRPDASELYNVGHECRPEGRREGRGAISRQPSRPRRIATASSPVPWRSDRAADFQASYQEPKTVMDPEIIQALDRLDRRISELHDVVVEQRTIKDRY